MTNACRLLIICLLFWFPPHHAIAGPITDVITVDGRKWAQVDLFLGLNWSDMNAVCPGGLCGTGTLNGFDMDRWRWASDVEVKSLFSSYMGAPIIGFRDEKAYSSWAPAFFADGWRHTESFMTGQILVLGNTSTKDRFGYWIGEMIDYDEPVILETQGTVRNDLAGVYRENRPIVDAGIGGWFYEVPNPSGLLLFCQALVTLAVFFRRQKMHCTSPGNAVE